MQGMENADRYTSCVPVYAVFITLVCPFASQDGSVLNVRFVSTVCVRQTKKW